MAESDAAVNVTHILTEQDLHRLTLTVMQRNKRLRVLGFGLGFFTVIMATGSFVVLARQASDWLVFVACLFFVLCLIVVVVPLYIRWSVRRAYRNNPNVQREISYRFSSQGIASSTTVSRGEVTWEAILEVLETKTDFIFFVSKQSAYLVPKTALPAPDERQRLRRIVMDAAGDRAKLRPNEDEVQS